MADLVKEMGREISNVIDSYVKQFDNIELFFSNSVSALMSVLTWHISHCLDVDDGKKLAMFDDIFLTYKAIFQNTLEQMSAENKKEKNNEIC